MRMLRRTLFTTLMTAGLTALTVAAPFGGPAPAAAACASRVGPGIPPPPSVPSGIEGFHASWYGQSGYPTLCPGETSTATVAYYNSGTRGWVSGRMGEMAFLGTWSPEPGQDSPSLLGGDGTNGSPATGWPRYNRVAAQPAAYVGPNQVSWFQFTIKAPTEPGTYELYIRPLVEGANWMEDFGVFWQVTVESATPLPPAASSGNRTVTVGEASTYGDYFTDTTSPATYRYDANDLYRYGGAMISMAQFELGLSSGDIIAVGYNADPAGVSTFDITQDAGRAAPTLTADVEVRGPGDGQGRNDVSITLTEPSSNLDRLTYSLQRTVSASGATSCDASSGTYTEIARLQMNRNSQITSYLDFNRPNGTYCYRAGAPNPVTGTTAFGYSNAATVAVP